MNTKDQNMNKTGTSIRDIATLHQELVNSFRGLTQREQETMMRAIVAIKNQATKNLVLGYMRKEIAKGHIEEADPFERLDEFLDTITVDVASEV